MLIKTLYSIFIGILVAAFIGFGVAAFYPAPEAPEPPEGLQHEPSSVEEREDANEERRALSEQYNEQQEEYRDTREAHARNTSVAVVVLSVAVLVLSLTSLISLSMVADGLLIGGILSLLYGVMRSFDAGDERLTFAVIAVGLLVAITVGYRKFADGESDKVNS